MIEVGLIIIADLHMMGRSSLLRPFIARDIYDESSGYQTGYQSRRALPSLKTASEQPQQCHQK